MCFNKITIKFLQNTIMEIRVIAAKQKLNYQKTDYTLTWNSGKKEQKERFSPLFELILKELKNEQKDKFKGEQTNE